MSNDSVTIVKVLLGIAEWLVPAVLGFTAAVYALGRNERSERREQIRQGIKLLSLELLDKDSAVFLQIFGSSVPGESSGNNVSFRERPKSFDELEFWKLLNRLEVLAPHEMYEVGKTFVLSLTNLFMERVRIDLDKESDAERINGAIKKHSVDRERFISAVKSLVDRK
ncbi:MAG: hypothetical protein Q8P60_10585 [Pseudorhodobacter sp.]|nr:hypothetical protein [Pseudorhodobacter sp.]